MSGVDVILQADARHIPLADETVQCCVTSPPYWGLRDYGLGGNGIGLEKTPEEYVQNIVQVFREVKRVLRPDGVVFLNLGDSYFSSSQREGSCGTSGKAPVGSPGSDCLCGGLCGVCREAYRRTSHTDPVIVAMLRASLLDSIPEHRASQTARPPTLGSLNRDGHSVTATQDRSGAEARAVGRLRASLASMLGESSPQLLDECLLRASRGECLLCGRSLGNGGRASGDMAACTCDRSSPESVDHKQSRDALGLAYPHYTTASLKPKDLVGIPWLAALALRADGWYLRSDIIWAKPNPMPESVTDRPTKSHEYIFLLSKSPRYFYDAEAVREPHQDAKGIDRFANSGGNVPGYSPGDKDGMARTTMVVRPGGREYNPSGRNRRDVWFIATQPYKGAHFATYPEKLVEPCILAGTSPKACGVCGAPWGRIVEKSGGTIGKSWHDHKNDLEEGASQGSTARASKMQDGTYKTETLGWRPTCDHNDDTGRSIVLDPFCGSGTTGAVARRLGRDFVGLDMSPDYLKLAEKRIGAVPMGMGL